ncbi:MAG: peptidase domain-containing ABC transporter [Hyphomicrobiales bacterium]|nr:peptidase domain-containing ABC transporter [Hyphomicrobiales bacterium]
MIDNNLKSNRPASLSWFLKSTSRYTYLIVELIIIAIVIRLLGLVQPFVFQALIDRVLPFQRISSLELILYILVGITIFSTILGVLSGLLGTLMANRLTSEMGGRIFNHSLKLPLWILQRFHVGETLARINEIDKVRVFLTNTVSGLILDLLFVMVYVAALLALSPFLTMIVLIMLPLQMMMFGIIGPFLRERLQDSFKAGAKHQSRIVEAYGNTITVKSLGSEELQKDRVSETLDASLFQRWRVAKLNVANGAIGELLNGLSVILVIYFGAQQVFLSELTLGQLIAFHLLAEKVSGPVFSLGTIWEQWQGLRIARLRLGDILNPTAENEPELPKLPAVSNVTLAIKNLTFGYEKDCPILTNLCFNCKPGRPTLIIGESGCGKSTLAKLMSGLYQPWEGRIKYEQHDISKFDAVSVRRRIGYVAQEPILFAGTILENLKMANMDATQEDIHLAVEASASQFINRLPQGFDTEVGERGGDLSGGQRQRIALARSLLTKPDVLVLDEPTSSLDEASAKTVMKTLEELSSTVTVAIITHRPDLVHGNKYVIDLGTAFASGDLEPSNGDTSNG